jgi:periplasmic glucans biosynthesis protein
MFIRRRHFMLSAAAAALSGPFRRSAAADDTGFSFDVVKEIARSVAEKPFQQEADPLPAPLHDLDYARFRLITFRPDRAFWRGEGDFRVELFHRGFQYDRKVTINLVDQGAIQEIGYAADLFDFGASGLAPDFPASLGFAGFRLHYPLNTPDYFDEFAVFQGGSYFRLIGRGERYGLSGRGLAIDTAEPQGEEFPSFTQFWILRPTPGAATVEIYALLDSKSTTGAYRFTLSPGAETVCSVEAVLYPRLPIRKPGLGVLTSMFLHGGAGTRPFADLRPQVHDSDGLLIEAGTGEHLWRPLVNPRALRVSTFLDQSPHGFGLLQRDRDFRDYQDPDEQYQARPSLWVEPRGDWAKGRLELIEIPSDDEINDNIVAYWVPQEQVMPGTPFPFAYQVTATRGGPGVAGGRCIETHAGPSRPVDASKNDRRGPVRFWVDFDDGELPGLAADQPVEAVVTSSTGRIDEILCRKLEPGPWRVAFLVTPDGRKDAELRAFLRLRGRSLSETWTYRWTAE